MLPESIVTLRPGLYGFYGITIADFAEGDSVEASTKVEVAVRERGDWDIAVYRLTESETAPSLEVVGGPGEPLPPLVAGIIRALLPTI